jgi:hypothetical protein
MAATEIVAVLDAGPLIHLDELGRLNLLNDFKELLVPQAVLDEGWRRCRACQQLPLALDFQHECG